MRILHTADWHLGKRTDDLDRMDELKVALREIIDISREYKVDMVIIAGDIYDSLVPSADAENLLYNTLSELSNNGNTAIVGIAGNHDEPKRFSNANVFARNFNINLVGYIDEIKIGEVDKSKNIYATECGKGYIKYHTAAGDDVVVVCLPYPSYYRYKSVKQEGENLNDSIKKWLEEGIKQFKDDTINIITAHALLYGENVSEEEMDDYYQINNTFPFVDKELFNCGADYVALGHLHTPITVSKTANAYYSGAIINNYFTPTNVFDKSVAIVDVTNKGVQNIKRVNLNSKKMYTIECNTLSDIASFCTLYPRDYVKGVLKDVVAVDFEKIKELRKDNPNLVTLSVLSKQQDGVNEVESKKDLTSGEIFEKFVLSKTGKAPDADVKELFLELMGENVYEAD